MARAGRPKADVTLGAEERETLERWARRAKSSQVLAMRSRIVLACADGLANKEIADRLRVRRDTVSKWRNRFARLRLAHGVHKSVRALENDIRGWIRQWNTDPKPFVWKKTAEEILESLSRYCGRISDAGH